MKLISMKWSIGILIIVCWLPLSQAGHAAVDWSIEKQIELESQPLDVATSEDGSLMFVLVPGEIIVYSLPAGTVSGTITVSRVFDGITYSQTKNRLFLRSSSSKVVRIVQVDLINQLNIDGRAFQGPPDAAVTIVVFDDYQ